MGRDQPGPDDPVSSRIKLATEGSPAKGSPVNKSKHCTLLAWSLFVTILSLATKGFLTDTTYQPLRSLKTHAWGPSASHCKFLGCVVAGAEPHSLQTTSRGASRKAREQAACILPGLALPPSAESDALSIHLPGPGFPYSHLLPKRMSFPSQWRGSFPYTEQPSPSPLPRPHLATCKLPFMVPGHYWNALMGDREGVRETKHSTITINLLETLIPSQGTACLGCWVGVMKAWAHGGGVYSVSGPWAFQRRPSACRPSSLLVF